MKGHVSDYRLKSGERRWLYVYDLPPDPDTGKRRQVWKRGFSLERDAQKALREALSLVDSGVTVAPSKATLADYLRAWLKGLSVKPTTLDNYRRCAEVYAIPRIGGIRLQNLQPEHLDSLYRELETSGKRDGTGLSPKSVRHVHTMLRRALQDAAERGHVLRNVADLAHPPTPEAGALTAGEGQGLVANATAGLPRRHRSRPPLDAMASHRGYGPSSWRGAGSALVSARPRSGHAGGPRAHGCPGQ